MNKIIEPSYRTVHRSRWLCIFPECRSKMNYGTSTGFMGLFKNQFNQHYIVLFKLYPFLKYHDDIYIYIVYIVIFIYCIILLYLCLYRLFYKVKIHDKFNLSFLNFLLNLKLKLGKKWY